MKTPNRLTAAPYGLKGTCPSPEGVQRSTASSAYFAGPYDPATFWEGHAEETAKWEHEQPDEPEILAIVRLIQPCRVLELGCGPGRNARYFATAARYVGIDIAPTYLRRAAEHQEANAVGLVCCDIGALPFTDERFDLVFADSTMQHVPPDWIDEAIAEAFRVTSRYVAIVEYTAAEGDFFDQIHLFAHDYQALCAPYSDLIWHKEVARSVQPARKEAFLFEKKEKPR